MHTRLVVLVTCLFGSLLVYPAHAQEEIWGWKRTILNRADLTGADGMKLGMEVIHSITEIPPGATIPQHFHNGIEGGYVLEGAMVQSPGKEPWMYATGTHAFNLRGVLHGGIKVVGDKALKIYNFHVVDKGKPLFDGVK